MLIGDDCMSRHNNVPVVSAFLVHPGIPQAVFLPRCLHGAGTARRARAAAAGGGDGQVQGILSTNGRLGLKLCSLYTRHFLTVTHTSSFHFI